MSLVTGRTPYLRLNLIDYNVEGWSDPTQENMYIIDSAVRQFAAYTGVQGTWKNSIDYAEDDVVVDTADSTLWQANVAHVSAASGTFAADRAANATYWTALTSGAINNNVNSVIVPESYGAVGDGVTEDSTALSNAAQAALAQSKPLQLDNKYRITSTIALTLSTYDRLRIQGTGEIYVDADLAGGAAFDIQVPAENTYAVTSIDNAITYDYGSGSASHSPVASMVLPSGHSTLNKFARLQR